MQQGVEAKPESTQENDSDGDVVMATTAVEARQAVASKAADVGVGVQRPAESVGPGFQECLEHIYRQHNDLNARPPVKSHSGKSPVPDSLLLAMLMFLDTCEGHVGKGEEAFV